MVPQASGPTLKADFEGKVRQVRELFADDASVGGVLFESQANYSWLTGGRGFVGFASEDSCASVLVTRDKAYVLTNRIEAGRIKDEETEGLEGSVEFVCSEWHTPSQKGRQIDEIIGGKALRREGDYAARIMAVRSRLTELGLRRAEWLCAESAAVTEDACRSLRPGVSELELAGTLSSALWSKGICPVVTLIAFDDRIRKYRHPIPTENRLAKQAMVVMCARRWGLVISLTRLTHFGPIDADLRRRHAAVATVDARMIAASKPGAPTSDVQKVNRDSYAELGFDGEWRLHHQGGMAGYSAREYVTGDEGSHVIGAGEMFAWNPSITGTKSEDTILIREGGNKVLTHTGGYGYLDVEAGGAAIPRPDILIL